MNEEQVFKSIAEHFARQPFGHLILGLILLLAFMLALAFVWALLQGRRQKVNGEILRFLIQRHRLKDFEVEILLSVAGRQGIRPGFLIMMDAGFFQEQRANIEDALSERLQIRAQAVRLLVDLENRLFRG